MFARRLAQRSSTSFSRIARLTPTSRSPVLAFVQPATRVQTMATTNGAPALEQKDVKQEAQHLANGNVSINNNWSSPGPAAFDFRSESPKPPYSRSTSAR